jgi:hypothetical protein
LHFVQIARQPPEYLAVIDKFEMPLPVTADRRFEAALKRRGSASPTTLLE